jgi:ribosomal protein S18 acetylase RimI-like enzyme
MTPLPVTTEELNAVVDLIAGEQVRPERQITYVGTESAGIRAELDGLEPSWAGTARVVHDSAGGVAGAVVVEWDERLGRAWVLGPWVAGDALAWEQHADALLEAALTQLPPPIDRVELSGAVANALLGDLVSARGFQPTEASHALVADRATVEGWLPPGDEAADLRPPVPGDAERIGPLHDAEFPGTYASAATLIEGHDAGERIVLVAPSTDGRGIAGYAAGRVQPDGEGFIDFVAVEPTARRTGLGRRLVQALARELVARSTHGRVSLTVQDRRTSARRLYGDLGFRADGSFVAYRNWTA